MNREYGRLSFGLKVRNCKAHHAKKLLVLSVVLPNVLVIGLWVKIINPRQFRRVRWCC